ncbi:hypothetical protein C2G38_2029596 [Gigaspora rosea]|uniref:Uncharacterized protein n=1 Tax=Gigaspora rosea TaxID=44941 RepID=A0A397W4J1_9GLOM|nr:hypothetical protein C2G38_2029596 [Gigaspora rosea]
MESNSSEQSGIYDVFNGPETENISLGSRYPLDELRTSYLHIANSDQNEIQTLYGRASTHMQIESFDEALVIMHQILDMEPNDLFSLINCGMLNLILDKNEEALLYLNRFLEIVPNDAYALVNRAKIYNKLNKHEEALADLNRSLADDTVYALTNSEEMDKILLISHGQTLL